MKNEALLRAKALYTALECVLRRQREVKGRRTLAELAGAQNHLQTLLGRELQHLSGEQYAQLLAAMARPKRARRSKGRRAK